VEGLPDGVACVTAPNPGPLTLEGTNTWIVDDWVVDPGPDIEDHVDRVLDAAEPGLGGIALTHSHSDHAQAAPRLAELAGGVAIVEAGAQPPDGFPFESIPTPGHSSDHHCLLWGRVLFSGDAVLGRGSVLLQPGEGGSGGSALGAYLDALRALRERDIEAICPGHGPIVRDPRERLDEYVEHRLWRERRLVAALDRGLRSEDELLDAAWGDAPPNLRRAAAHTLRAHVEKLAHEGRLPDDLTLDA
jgi:glyoxylase-like metal-dependent hydrolase (beta-lactamase superfamily II)